MLAEINTLLSENGLLCKRNVEFIGKTKRKIVPLQPKFT